MAPLPVREAAGRTLTLLLPPDRMPLMRGRRPLKRWRHVGVFGPELMLCGAEVFVGPLATRYWGLAFPDGELLARRSLVGSGGVSIAGSRLRIEARAQRAAATAPRRVSVDIELDERTGPPGVESVSGSGGAATFGRASAPACRLGAP
ncbi:MAG: hypothetical protein M3502_06565 [Actinomycetota bacterium]|jgi:hypothetical protein|nr:hypothetical protein [Actinomycetota bacterium]